MSASLLIETRNVDVALGARKVLYGVDFALCPGEMTGVLGPNGSGKSTLLRTLAGLLPVAGGEVLMDGRPLHEWARRARARFAGYLPQGGECHWPVPVRRLAEIGRLPHAAPWGRPRVEDERAVRSALEQVDLGGLEDRIVETLSGGEMARALLARVLAGEPQVILADEPLAGLDPYHQLQIMELFHSLARAGRGVAVVLHDLGIASRFCDRLVLLHEGRVLGEGGPGAVLTPENMRRAFQIEAHVVCEGDVSAVVPLRRTDPADS